MVDNGLLKDNRVFFNKSTEEYYKNVFILHEFRITPFFKPFYYLQFDGFWHLKAKNDNLETKRISSKFIRDNIEYAYLDNALWDLLQDASIRAYFKSIIESHHLKK
jgi:putative restriction endonuclease